MVNGSWLPNAGKSSLASDRSHLLMLAALQPPTQNPIIYLTPNHHREYALLTLLYTMTAITML